MLLFSIIIKSNILPESAPDPIFLYNCTFAIKNTRMIMLSNAATTNYQYLDWKSLSLVYSNVAGYLSCNRNNNVMKQQRFQNKYFWTMDLFCALIIFLCYIANLSKDLDVSVYGYQQEECRGPIQAQLNTMHSQDFQIKFVQSKGQLSVGNYNLQSC